MVIIIVLLTALLVFDIAALRWGFDSTESVDSPEWERRRQWEALHSLAGQAGNAVRRKR
jgi:hypothetical protein